MILKDLKSFVLEPLIPKDVQGDFSDLQNPKELREFWKKAEEDVGYREALQKASGQAGEGR